MCGRFSSQIPIEQLARVFEVTGPLPNTPPCWNLAPSMPAPVVRRHPETGERRLDLLRFGLIPWHESDPKGGRKPINARAETVATTGMFRAAFAKRRCIVPAGAFYEWQKLPDGRKQPYAIARQDGEPLALGGIWETWKDPDGELVRTFAIITTPPNALMARIHDRMPLVLQRADWPLWLGEVEGDAAALMHPAFDDVLRAWPVSARVGSPRNNDADLLAPTVQASEAAS